MEDTAADKEESVFQKKYNEFVEDLLGALPEYNDQITAASKLDDATRLSRYQQEVNVQHTLRGNSEEFNKNPHVILPGVDIADPVWQALSENTKKAIWEHVRILSICCFMEAGFNEQSKPSWMEDAMNEMKKKLESVDFKNIIGKFMKFMNPVGASGDAAAAGGAAGAGAIPGMESLFENGFPKLPERFLKGHMARLSQEIV